MHVLFEPCPKHRRLHGEGVVVAVQVEVVVAVVVTIVVEGVVASQPAASHKQTPQAPGQLVRPNSVITGQDVKSTWSGCLKAHSRRSAHSAAPPYLQTSTQDIPINVVVLVVVSVVDVDVLVVVVRVVVVRVVVVVNVLVTVDVEVTVVVVTVVVDVSVAVVEVRVVDVLVTVVVVNVVEVVLVLVVVVVEQSRPLFAQHQCTRSLSQSANQGCTPLAVQSYSSAPRAT